MSLVLYTLMCCGPCAAAPIPKPTKLFIKHHGEAALIDLENTEDVERVYLIGVAKWVQGEDGTPRLSATKDITVDKTTVTIPAHGVSRLTIKLAAQHRPGRVYYRLTIGDPPTAKRDLKPGVTVRSRIDLPIFVGEPASGPRLVVDPLAARDGTLGFSLNNLGGDYGRPDKVTVQAVGKDAKYREEWEGWYLLPDTPRRYLINVSKADCAGIDAFEVEVQNGAERINRRFENSPSLCEGIVSRGPVFSPPPE